MEDKSESPLAEALSRVGDRWTLLIVEALIKGPRRFGDLSDDIQGIAPNILSQRLKHLERESIVVGRPYSKRPLRLIYELSAEGRELAGAVRLLTQWGARRGDENDLPHHSACGTELEVRWYCPTCARIVDEPEEGELRHL